MKKCANPNDAPLAPPTEYGNVYPSDYFTKRQMSTYEVEKIIEVHAPEVASQGSGTPFGVFLFLYVVLLATFLKITARDAAEVRDLRQQVTEMQKATQPKP